MLSARWIDNKLQEIINDNTTSELFPQARGARHLLENQKKNIEAYNKLNYRQNWLEISLSLLLTLALANDLFGAVIPIFIFYTFSHIFKSIRVAFWRQTMNNSNKRTKSLKNVFFSLTNLPFEKRRERVFPWGFTPHSTLIVLSTEAS